MVHVLVFELSITSFMSVGASTYLLITNNDAKGQLVACLLISSTIFFLMIYAVLQLFCFGRQASSRDGGLESGCDEISEQRIGSEQISERGQMESSDTWGSNCQIILKQVVLQPNMNYVQDESGDDEYGIMDEFFAEEEVDLHEDITAVAEGGV